uniref:Uncharacterized protein n=1 Tax=Candidatus Kentrum sp. FM TaxID=2126340 RepID=A0A450S7G6_9GAMM|nr:MAG: hypothetical protein BECKFM1743A_GA0114220_1004720 [Candidatus Kentron sp. FM]VFJ47818.1 MAG: hypothetical protein BECKFM1743C_GA0114222_100511 [Candidatus Kentron sp. FM]VFK07876.1 MAG: hypothetical protein BECKFM1743B_GA0114221_1005219 [Candidatus Kentron sp. FM]
MGLVAMVSILTSPPRTVIPWPWVACSPFGMLLFSSHEFLQETLLGKIGQGDTVSFTPIVKATIDEKAYPYPALVLTFFTRAGTFFVIRAGWHNAHLQISGNRVL